MRISDWSSDVCSSDLELLDARVAGPLPERDDFAPQCAQALAHEATEAALMVLNETRQALSFRIALATLDGRQHAQERARPLAWLADAVMGVVLQLALRETRRAPGDKIGRARCRERVCQVGYVWVVAASLQKQ